ncbi:uncharacterized protein LOC113235312 [Hyposmocoma kahamanoa]|uniref:uncharacterized protein LOC113235312 n=1 Tax=Hyposmocoma kahamanoa TaxID=1477025 RepID=UPI000E6D8EB5|nr:uncharacterized protein LOC113235312 [Hyposmocoma kahamanoa]
MKSAIGRCLQHFLKNTTLHGFKYIISPYYIDRIVWIMWCIVSASCAGALFAVLWARFLQVPALLTLQAQDLVQPMPLVGICLTPHTTANVIAQSLTANTSALWLTNNTDLVAFIIQKLLEKKITSKGNLLILENLQ